MSYRRTCVFCQNRHQLIECDQFGTLAESARNLLIRENKLCELCLRGGHTSPLCPNRAPIWPSCGRSLLDGDYDSDVEVVDSEECDWQWRLDLLLNNLGQPQGGRPPSRRSRRRRVRQQRQESGEPPMSLQPCGSPVVSVAAPAFAPTLKARVQGGQRGASLRAILNSLTSGTEVSAAWARCNGFAIRNQYCTLRLVSRQNAQRSFVVRALAKEEWTCQAPSRSLDKIALQPFGGLMLADPDCYQSGPVDLILGAEYYSQVMGVDQVTVQQGRITAQPTIFGYILTGVWL